MAGIPVLGRLRLVNLSQLGTQEGETHFACRRMALSYGDYSLLIEAKLSTQITLRPLHVRTVQAKSRCALSRRLLMLTTYGRTCASKA